MSNDPEILANALVKISDLCDNAEYANSLDIVIEAIWDILQEGEVGSAIRRNAVLEKAYEA